MQAVQGVNRDGEPLVGHRRRRRIVAVLDMSTAERVRPGRERTRPVWAWVRLLVGLGILGLLVWRVGTGPFLYGIRSVDATALMAAFAVGVVVTVGCAWRWSVIASGLGVRLRMREAVAS